MKALKPVRRVILCLTALFGSLGAMALPSSAQSIEECFRVDNDLERLMCIRRSLSGEPLITPEQAFEAFESQATLAFRPALGGHQFFFDDCTLHSMAATADGSETALVSSRRRQQQPEAFRLPRGLDSYERVRLRALEINLAEVERVAPAKRPTSFDITMRRGETFYSSTVIMSLANLDQPPVYASGRDATFVARRMASLFDVFFDGALDQRTLTAVSRSADALEASLNLSAVFATATGEGGVTVDLGRRTAASRSGSWPFARGQADAASDIFDAFNTLVTTCQAAVR